MKCFATMLVRGKVKFCVGFVLKYVYVNYENTQEKDAVCLCLLFFSLVSLKTRATIYLQIFLNMSSGMTCFVPSQICGGTFLHRRR